MKIYPFLNSILYPFLLPPSIVWMKRKRGYPLNLKSRFFPEINKKYTHFFHLASLGEAKTVNPLIGLWDQYRKSILFESVTPTGYEELQKMGVDVILFPFDYYPVLVRNFRKSGVKEVFIFETQLWPGLLVSAFNLNLKIRMLNVKFSHSTMEMLRKGTIFWKKILVNVSEWLVVEKEVENFLVDYGISRDKIKVVLDLKYLTFFKSIEVPDELSKKLKSWISEKRKIVVLGSMHNGEETIIERIDFKEFKVIYAPRHLHDLDFLKKFFEKKGIRVSLLSEEVKQNTDLLLVDRYGVLAPLYSFGDIAVIGGSFIPHGGHNPLEAIYFKKPVIFGKHMENFKEIARDLVECGGGVFAEKKEIGLILKSKDKIFPEKKIRDCFEQLKSKSEIVRKAYSEIMEQNVSRNV